MVNATTITELERLLTKQKQRVQALQKRKERLAAQIQRIDKQIDSVLGKPPAPKPARRVRRRRKAGKSLQQAIVDVLSGSPQPKTAAEIAEAVQAAGYRSESKSFVSLVRQMCYRSDQIQTKERGKFVLGSAPKAPARAKKRKKAPAK
jgi:uncharacterized membrane protein YccC